MLSKAQTNLLILMATMYALYFAFLTPPILTNSEFNAMFYDPFIGDVPTEVVRFPSLVLWLVCSDISSLQHKHKHQFKQKHFQYVNWPHTANNLLVVMTSATLYLLLIFVVRRKQVQLAFFLKNKELVIILWLQKSKTSEVGRRKKLAVNGPVQIYIFN